MRVTGANLPAVSVIIPARDASAGLDSALRSVSSQTYPNIVEVVVAAADDESAATARQHGATVLKNREGSTSAGLNLAVSAALGEVVVRCDAFSILPPQYVERAVETLSRTGADNVGGMQVPQGQSFWERAIAAAMASPLGAGDARYRIGGGEGSVETVYLGVFKRSTLEQVGSFDEAFDRTQDYELNHRIIESGGTVWFDPELKVEYRPRGSLRALARQYFDYGRAKRQFNRKHPRTLRWRQLAAPTIVLTLVGSLAVSVAWTEALVAPLFYLGGLIVAGLVASRRAGVAAAGVPLALGTMHIAWGLGFITGRESAS